MKKLLLVLLGLVSLSTYAVNPTQGPLQQDPSLCGYGYNPNCGQGAGSSGKKIIEHKIVYLPSKYGAVAFDRKTATLGSSTYMDSEVAAKKGAIQSCQKGNRKLSCKIIALYGNGCIAVVSGSQGKQGLLFKFVDENPGGYAVKKAMEKCEKSGASDCQILIREQCSL